MLSFQHAVRVGNLPRFARLNLRTQMHLDISDISMIKSSGQIHALSCRVVSALMDKARFFVGFPLQRGFGGTRQSSQDDTEAALKVAQDGSNPWLQSSKSISCLETFFIVFLHWNCLVCLLSCVWMFIVYARLGTMFNCTLRVERFRQKGDKQAEVPWCPSNPDLKVTSLPLYLPAQVIADPWL